MKIDKGILAFSFLFLVDLALGDVFYNLVSREDPCIALCEKTPLSFTNSKYVKSCCQRGCRFFNLVDLRYGLEPGSLNGTRDACEASCTEAYTEPQDRYACSTGCDFMAKQRISDLVSLFSVAIYVEEGADSSILLMSPDLPESDVLTDPGLRKELSPGWWDSNGFKLPRTYIKTVPIDSGTIDYGVPSDYSAEPEQSMSLPGSDWLQCASRHTGIPRWCLLSGSLWALLMALWLWTSPEKPSEPAKDMTIEKPNTPSKVAIYIPDEAPLHKKPPPKYDSIDTNVNFKPKTDALLSEVSKCDTDV